jgi:glycogen(starch) synthase
VKILHVCLDYPPRRTRYGSGTVNDHVLDALIRAGHDVAVVAPGRAERRHRGQPGSARLVEVPVALSTRHLLPTDRPTEMFATPGAVRAWNDATVGWLAEQPRLGLWVPDVIHNDGWTTQSVADALSREFGCPVVTTAHVIDRHYVAARRRVRPLEHEFQAAEERSFRNSHRIVVPSVTTNDVATYYFPHYADKIRVVPHGLHWADIDRACAAVPPAPRDTRHIIVHYLGRISSERGWEPLLGAFVAAAELDRRLRLRVVGDGVRLAEAADRYQHPAVSFVGALPHHLVLREFHAGDIFCNPALTETFGLAELEAMGRGLCVVSNTGFGKNTHVNHLDTGVRIPLGTQHARMEMDRGGWTGWLTRLAADPGLRHRLGAAAREVARADYRVEDMAERLVDVFREAAS